MTPLILLVDDDSDFLDIHRHILETHEYRVTAATSVGEAVDRMAAERPDAVVTDLMMDRLDAGFSLARRIKEDARFAGIPVIIVTAAHKRLGVDLRPKGPGDLTAMGADAWFQKPVPAQALLDTLRALLSKARP